MARIVVDAGRRAVVRVDGAVVDVLGTGRHVVPGRRPWRRRSIAYVDVREQLLVLPTQEVAALDVPGVKVSAAARWRVVDPLQFLDVSADPVEQLRLALQLAVRDWAAAAVLDRLVADRAGSGPVLHAAVAAVGGRLGVEVVEAAVRDIVVPAEVRRAAAAVASARFDAVVRLEQARAETAALRSLANAARLLEQHPGLLQLRTAEAVGRSGGTVVLGGRPSVGADSLPA